MPLPAVAHCSVTFTPRLRNAAIDAGATACNVLSAVPCGATGGPPAACCGAATTTVSDFVPGVAVGVLHGDRHRVAAGLGERVRDLRAAGRAAVAEAPHVAERVTVRIDSPQR